MRKKDYIRLADIYKTQIDELNKNLLEFKMRCNKLQQLLDNEHRENIDNRSKYDRDMLEAKLKNDALVSAMTSKDTEIFIYNGDTYKVTKLNLTKSGDSLDTLNLELIKYDVAVKYNGGLVGIMQETIKMSQIL